MLRKVASASLLVAAALAYSGTASAGPNNVPAPAQSATADAQKKVCKREVDTGSVMPKRICKTLAEWNAMTSRGQSNLDQMREQSHSRDMVGGSR
jgi:hypothetical protein